MSLSILVKTRLAKLGYGQKDSVRAVQVTDSYISQLLTRRKAPPGRDRTDIYGKMEAFLRLEPGELGRLAEIGGAEELQRRLGRAPEPPFQHFRELVLRKCVPEKRDAVRVLVAEPGLTEFLDDPRLSGDVTEKETGLLRQHRFTARRPNKLYYYRLLQSLRDPLHFAEE